MKKQKTAFIKILNRYIFLILIVLFVFSIEAKAQTSNKLANKWKKPEKFVEIPEAFKDEDAVAIFKKVYINNMFISRTFYARYSITSKVRILTKKGLEENSKITVLIFKNGNTETLDLRTIKQSGEVKRISEEDIVKLKRYDELNDQYYDEYRISAPGLEVGDEIEYTYSSIRKGIIRARDIYLQGELATMQSVFTLYTSAGIFTDIYSMNQMPKPLVSNIDDQDINKWELTNLPSLKSQPYYVGDNELPYIKFKTRKIKLTAYNYEEDLSIGNWSELYSEYVHSDDERNSKSKGLDAYFKSFKSKLDTLDRFGKVAFFVNKINNEMEIVDKVEDIPIVEIIKNGKIDFDNLISFYTYMFYYLEIPNEVCFGKSRYEGELLYDIISEHQITDLFLAFTDEKNIRHFLFNSDSNDKLFIDEFPYKLEDTKLILLKKNNPFNNEKPTVSFLSIGHLPPANNMRSLNYYFKVLPDSDKVLVDLKGVYTGMSSMYNRGKWLKEIKKKDNKSMLKFLGEDKNNDFKLDTTYVEELSQDPPYKFKYRVKSELGNVISDAAGGIKTLKINYIIGHSYFPFSRKERITDAFLPYQFHDDLITFIEFPYDVTILNEQEITKKLENEIGVFDLSITKISGKVYKVGSNYQCKAQLVPKAKYKSLVELNELVDQYKELSILYKAN